MIEPLFWTKHGNERALSQHFMTQWNANNYGSLNLHQSANLHSIHFSIKWHGYGCRDLSWFESYLGILVTVSQSSMNEGEAFLFYLPCFLPLKTLHSSHADENWWVDIRIEIPIVSFSEIFLRCPIYFLRRLCIIRGNPYCIYFQVYYLWSLWR